MSTLVRFTRAAAAALLGSATVAGCTAPLQSEAHAPTLQALASTPETAGDLVYRGKVYAPNRGPHAAPVFDYERRVTRAEAEGFVSTHVSFDPDGNLAVADVAAHDSEYRVHHFDSLHTQTDTEGSMRIDETGRVHFAVTRNGRRRTRSERASGPVLVGPTLFGYALAHWDALLNGETLKIRFAVIERARTYGFTLRLQSTDLDTTTLTMAATSLLTRASVPPMRLVFDTTTRKIIRYEGRVPPLVEEDGKLKPLDARVEYAFATEGYR